MKNVVIVLLIAVAIAHAEERRVVAKLDSPNKEVRGNITFTQTQSGAVVKVEGIIEGLKPGLHGFHIHEKGDITGGCGSTGGHFNPEKKSHGGPMATERHVGDLGNIEATVDGIAQVLISDSKISLFGDHSILGRGLVVHANVDDLGQGGFPDSLTTGNAGGRVACGVIGVQQPVGAWQNSAPIPRSLTGLALLVLGLVFV